MVTKKLFICLNVLFFTLVLTVGRYAENSVAGVFSIILSECFGAL